MLQPTKIAIIQNIVPIYRKGFYDKILANKNYKITIFCNDKIPFLNVLSVHNLYSDNVNLINFYSNNKYKILIQKLPFFNLKNQYDILIFDGNPRHLTQVIFATILRMLGKRVVISSSAHSRRNHSVSIFIRQIWWKIFKYFMLYNEKDISILEEAGFKKKVLLSLNNGLDQEEINAIKSKWNQESLSKWKGKNKLTNRIVLLTVGRLNRGKYEIMLSVLPELVKEYPQILWCIIGDGDGKMMIEEEICRYNLNNNVKLCGAIYDEEELAPWFLSSFIFVYPTAIGLSLLHSYGYGLPVITHNDSNIHGPEFSLFKEYETGLTYNNNSPDSLLNVLKNAIENPQLVNKMRLNVLFIANEKYNTKIMAARFDEFISLINTDK